MGRGNKTAFLSPPCPSGAHSCLAQPQPLEETLGPIHGGFKALLCTAGSRAPAKSLTGTHWALVKATAACSKVASSQARSHSLAAGCGLGAAHSWKWRPPLRRRLRIRASVSPEAAKLPSANTVSLSDATHSPFSFLPLGPSVASSQTALPDCQEPIDTLRILVSPHPRPVHFAGEKALSDNPDALLKIGSVNPATHTECVKNMKVEIREEVWRWLTLRK